MSRRLLLLLLAVAASGCGVRGPLYLPERAPAEEVPAAGADEPRQEETEDGEEAER